MAQIRAKREASERLGSTLLTPKSVPHTPPPLQPKLTIGQPGDRYEQEADRVARQVVDQINAPPKIQPQVPPNPMQSVGARKPSPLDNHPVMKVQRHSTGGEMEASPDLESSIQRARGGGQPLDDGIRERMEGAFGADFSGVRVHTDGTSDQLNQSIQAKAFTTGQNVFFRQGAYNPGSRGGQELLAHELTHVVQQSGGGENIQSEREQTLPSEHTVGYRQKAEGAIEPSIQRSLIVGLGKSKEKYFRLSPIAPPKNITDKIRKRTPRVRLVYSVLCQWSRSSEKHEYTTWNQAIIAALRVALEHERTTTRIHEPETPPSPFTDSQQEEIDYLNNEGRTAEHMKDKAVWNELKIHGQLGEHGHQGELNQTGIKYEDANNFLGYNAPGIDTLVNVKGRSFGQSKMHIAEGANVKDIVQHYLNHADKAEEYAQTFLNKVLLDNTSGKNKREAIKKVAEEWNNETLRELVSFFDTTEWVASKDELIDILDGSINSKGDLELSQPVQVVAKAMHFPVPLDVYEYIKTHHAEYIHKFEKLPKKLDWYRKVKMGMQYKINKPIKNEEEKDETYTEKSS